LPLIQDVLHHGFVRLRIDEDIVDLTQDAVRAIASRLKGAAEMEVVLDRLVLHPDERARLTDTVETAFREGGGRCAVEIIGAGRRRFAHAYGCQSCGRTFETPKPALFSFNHPLGACPACKGFGNILRYDEDLIVPNQTKNLAGGCIEPWTKPSADWWQKEMLLAFKRRGLDIAKPYNKLTQAERKLLWEGDTGKGPVEGINAFFEYLEGKRYKLHVRVLLSRYRSPVTCENCAGTRLRPEALAVRVCGRTITEVADMTIVGAAEWTRLLPLSSFEREIAKDILGMLNAKLGFLLRVGLGYLTLSRQTRTLSGGEGQRISLATQLGAQLTGTLYVLDEPTIGLHTRDTATLAGILTDLAKAGNTVIMVEHDRTMIETAHFAVEMGPAAGEKGGEIVCAARLPEFLAHPSALTARYLTGQETIPLPRRRRKGTRSRAGSPAGST
ncbi:MAG: excinuclease ABC subunit A, partial [Nitrospirota bacterium]